MSFPVPVSWVECPESDLEDTISGKNVVHEECDNGVAYRVARTKTYIGIRMNDGRSKINPAFK